MKINSPISGYAIDLALLACLSIFSLYATARIALAPRDPANGVALVFAPWTAQESAFARAVEAGGRFVRFGGAPFIVVMMPDGPDTMARLAAAGAWLLADPLALDACLPKLSGETQ